MDKGTFSNAVSAVVFGTGLVLPPGAVRDAFVSVGLFAFSGGITNALAVKMLFDRVPGLAGSGVIPARFREIRAKVKSVILERFFEEDHLRRYIAEEAGKVDWRAYLKGDGSGSGPVAAFVERQWDRLAGPAALEPLIDEQIERLMDSSVGGLLMMMGPAAVKPAVTQFVGALAGALKGRLLGLAAKAEAEQGVRLEIDEEKLARDIRRSVDQLLARKLEELDPQAVKRMMEDVIRRHLGWLVVWGSVTGGLLGLVPLLLKEYCSS
ncbi:MAG: hypothetical protein HY721_28380 [Planctomycetes bacterium]|nr:hypothetical protein [Planctomycetota bacterium]